MIQAHLQPPKRVGKVLTQAYCKGRHLAPKILYDGFQRKYHILALHLRSMQFLTNRALL